MAIKLHANLLYMLKGSQEINKADMLDIFLTLRYLITQ